jgi:hypothetical protein
MRGSRLPNKTSARSPILPTQVPAMSESFSTDLVPAADRFDAWSAYAKQICGDCRFHFLSAFLFSFSRLHRAPNPRRIGIYNFPFLGGVVRQISCGDRKFAGPGLHRYHATSGHAILLPMRRYRIAAPGDTTLVDAAQPWTSECAGDCAGCISISALDSPGSDSENISASVAEDFGQARIRRDTVSLGNLAL